MNNDAAKKIFMKYDCSHFSMAREAWPEYSAYLSANITREQENLWRQERLSQIKTIFEASRDYRSFSRLYDFAEQLNTKDAWIVVNEMLPLFRAENTNQLVAFLEDLIGRAPINTRKGLVFWTFDLGKEDEARLLADWIEQQLISISSDDSFMEKRISNDLVKLAEIRANIRN